MPPLTVMIKPVSSLCNMSCRYCFYADEARHRQTPRLGVMSERTLENTVRRALSYADGTLTFMFQGGEPTLADTDFYRAFIELERKYNSRGVRIINALQTNGYCISEEMLDLFAREHFLIGVSYDGTPELHDLIRVGADGGATSEKVLHTIARLRERSIEFNILCVVTEQLAARPREVFNALAEYGYLQFIPCLDGFDGETSPFSLTDGAYLSFLKATFDLYYKRYRQGSPVSVRTFDNFIGMLQGMPPENCAMSGRCAQYYLIEADGSVYPCDFYALDKWKLGNINDDSFFRLARSPVAAEFRGSSALLPSECPSCRWYSLCHGGCRREREPFSTETPQFFRWCSCTKAFLEYAYPKMREIARLVQGDK